MTTPSDQTSADKSPAGEAAVERRVRKLMRGMVMSTKMDKTIIVQVNRKVRHPLYEKFVSKRTKLYAHDDQSEANVGDIVEITQTRPLSKLKRWRLLRIVQKSTS